MPRKRGAAKAPLRAITLQKGSLPGDHSKPSTPIHRITSYPDSSTNRYGTLGAFPGGRFISTNPLCSRCCANRSAAIRAM